MKPRPGADAARAASGRLRIIAGRWRGSRLDVPDLAGLRPTSDRVRETLFNWLAPELGGASCLDLFAGSGALGFEAGSRGAARVWMIERERAAADVLRATATRLGADQVEVCCGDALAWLAAEPSQRFDVAFVDPPFGAGLLDAALAALPRWLAPQAWIYVESARAAVPTLPEPWRLHREGATRGVRYALYQRAAAASAASGPATLAPDSPGACAGPASDDRDPMNALR